MRGESGGLILCFESLGVVGVTGVGVCGVVSSVCLAFFFGGFCGGMGGGGVGVGLFIGGRGFSFSGGGNSWWEGG